ncbi:hypothetical protein EX227_14215 [Providencia rettgeri]|uniref:Uncharacterized protein n=1 Tax=Providencia rettgeri TaxID=587 RepID=A0AAP2JWF7_PRORE|nr:TraA family conjugative transfer protein [Providencia rettgeri]ELI9034656.1 hypothetical protein [Morganella morganii]MBX6950040.1 hypothetical protein [Providencia rettgeri]MBX6956162.1 hypothetical protein [Providencia rettgeri]MBX6958498.1 hypothetical protein [Providencia rettgeri]MBX6971502.1 hypothetical protein [Providencia rettgeri]
MRILTTSKIKSVMAATAVLALGVTTAYAEDGFDDVYYGAGWDSVWEVIYTYMQGALGRILVGLIALVGTAAAVIRQSLMTFAVAIGAALGLSFGPGVILEIMLPGATYA